MRVSYSLYLLFQFYFILIILRVLLSWIPNIDWYAQPFKMLSLLTDSFLNIFRKVIPPLGGLDFSPVIAIIVLQVVQYLVVNGLAAAGL